jgi:hypothetical protein
MTMYLTRWRTRNGRRRNIRLYKSWNNLNARLAGSNVAGNGSRPWKGLPNAFESWPAFRSWAVANGYSKARCSLDRKDASQGYGPENCQWLTVAENTKKMNDDWKAEAALHPDGVTSNMWTEQQLAEGVPF